MIRTSQKEAVVRVLRSVGLGVALALVTAAPAFAQRAAIPRSRSFGVAGGIAVTRLSGYINSVEDRTGPFIGAWAARDISENFGLQLEINFVRKGGKGFLPAPFNENLWDLRVDYLEFPLMVNYFPNFSPSEWGFGAYAGIGIGFALGCQADIGNSGRVPCKDTVLGGTNVDWSIPFGAQIGRNLSNGSSVYLDVRYSLGLSNVTDFQVGNTSYELKNRAWEIILRYGLPMD